MTLHTRFSRCAAGLIFGAMLGASLAVILGATNAAQTVSIVVFAAAYGALGLLLGILNPKLADRWTDLFWFLGLPMATIAVACFALSRVVLDVGWQSLLVNLAASAVAVLVTVFFVDVVIQRNSAARWAAVAQVVLGELITAASGVLTRMVVLHHGEKPTNEVVYVGKDVSLFDLDEDYVRFVEEHVEPGLAKTLSEFTEEEWAKLANALQAIAADFENLLPYSDRLEPETLKAIYEIRGFAKRGEQMIRTNPIIRWDPMVLNALVAHSLSSMMRNSIALLRANWGSWDIARRAREKQMSAASRPLNGRPGN